MQKQKQTTKQMFFELLNFIREEFEKTEQNYKTPSQTSLNFKKKLQKCSKSYRAN